MMEDIPIFYLASKDPQTEFYWGYTGYSMFDKTKYNPHRHRVYFTTELVIEIGHRVIPHEGPHASKRGGAWDIVAPDIEYTTRNGWHGWIVKHSSGYVWKLRYEDRKRVDGHVLGVWPD